MSTLRACRLSLLVSVGPAEPNDSIQARWILLARPIAIFLRGWLRSYLDLIHLRCHSSMNGITDDQWVSSLLLACISPKLLDFNKIAGLNALDHSAMYTRSSHHQKVYQACTYLTNSLSGVWGCYAIQGTTNCRPHVEAMKRLVNEWSMFCNQIEYKWKCSGSWGLQLVGNIKLPRRLYISESAQTGQLDFDF